MLTEKKNNASIKIVRRIEDSSKEESSNLKASNTG